MSMNREGFHCKTKGFIYHFLVLGLLAYGFQEWGVQVKVTQMTNELLHASTFQREQLLKVRQMEEFQRLHHQVTQLHRESFEHFHTAYQLQYKTVPDLARKIHDQVLLMDEEAKEESALEEQAKQDDKLSHEWEEEFQFDDNQIHHMDETGIRFAHQAEVETSQGQAILKQAAQAEQTGQDRLDSAKEQLDQLFQSNNNDDFNQMDAGEKGGFCYWASWVCDVLQRSDGNVSVPADKLASIGSEVASAMAQVQEAKVERAYGMSLLAQASQDTNASIAILQATGSLTDESKKELHEAKKLLEQATEEHSKASHLIQNILELDQAVHEEEEEIDHDKETSVEFLQTARLEDLTANRLEDEEIQTRKKVDQAELEIRAQVFHAEQHVAHACWYALFAMVLASMVLLLSVVRLVEDGMDLFSERPERWLIRRTSARSWRRDLSYCIAHCLILLTIVTFCSELLHELHRYGFLGTSTVFLLCALLGSTSQILVLHIAVRCWRRGDALLVNLSSSTSGQQHATHRLLSVHFRSLWLLLFYTFALEITLVWIICGKATFLWLLSCGSNVLVWILTASYLAVHLWFFELQPVFSMTTRIASTMTTTSGLPPSTYSSTNESAIPTTSASKVWQAGLDTDTISTMTNESSSLLTVDFQSSSTGQPQRSFDDFSANTGSSNQCAEWLFMDSNIDHRNCRWLCVLLPCESSRLKLSFLCHAILASWAVFSLLRTDVRLFVTLLPLSPALVWGSLPWPCRSILLLLCFLLGGLSYTRNMTKNCHHPSNDDTAGMGAGCHQHHLPVTSELSRYERLPVTT